MVTLLDGIISGESPKSVADPHPILLTPLPEREFTTPSAFFLSRPVRRGLAFYKLGQAIG
jgi:hypothetical protein